MYCNYIVRGSFIYIKHGKHRGEKAKKITIEFENERGPGLGHSDESVGHPGKSSLALDHLSEGTYSYLRSRNEEG